MLCRIATWDWRESLQKFANHPSHSQSPRLDWRPDSKTSRLPTLEFIPRHLPLAAEKRRQRLNFPSTGINCEYSQRDLYKLRLLAKS